MRLTRLLLAQEHMSLPSGSVSAGKAEQNDGAGGITREAQGHKLE